MRDRPFRITEAKKVEWMNRDKEWLVKELAKSREKEAEVKQRVNREKMAKLNALDEISPLREANNNLATLLIESGRKPYCLEITYLYRKCESCEFYGDEWCECSEDMLCRKTKTLLFYTYTIDDGYIYGILSDFRSYKNWDVLQIVDQKTGRIIFEKEC